MSAGTAFSIDEYKQRLSNIQQHMKLRQADVLVVDASEYLAYFGGFDPQLLMYRALIVPAVGEPFMILRELDEGLFKEVAWVSDYVTFSDWSDPIEIMVEILNERGFGKSAVALDLKSYALSVSNYETLRTRLPNARFIDMSEELIRVGLIKSDAEIQYLRRAAGIADSVMRETIDWVHEGVTERAALEFASAGFFRHGADQYIVGPITSGTSGNFLHGKTHDRPLKAGDILHMELVPKFRGYSSRVMRPTIIGEPSRMQQDVATRLIELQNRQLEAVRPGVLAKEIDAICRKGVVEAGLWTSYANVTGYTLGYYSSPTVRGANFFRAFHPKADWSIEERMVFHFYISASGLAFSETVLVTSNGCERLTKTDRRLFSK